MRFSPSRIKIHNKTNKKRKEVYFEYISKYLIQSSDPRDGMTNNHDKDNASYCRKMCPEPERQRFVSLFFHKSSDLSQALSYKSSHFTYKKKFRIFFSRLEHNIIHPFEFEGRRMVKQFSRSAAGQVQNRPQDMRSPKLCQRTARYLVKQ